MIIPEKIKTVLKEIIEDKKLINKNKRGRPCSSLDNIINGILFFLINNTSWNEMNKTIFGNGKTLNYHFTKFSKAGVFQELNSRILKNEFENNKLDLSKICIDSTNIKNRLGSNKDCLGKCYNDRGRLGTKISLISDRRGIPITHCFFPCNTNDYSTVQETFQNYPSYFPEPSRKKPTYVLADKGYDSESIRSFLRSKKFIPKIPMINKKKRKFKKVKNGKKYNPRYEYSLAVHDKDRNNIEMTFGILKNFKRLIMRYERKLIYYSSLCSLACSIVILKRSKK